MLTLWFSTLEISISENSLNLYDLSSNTNQISTQFFFFFCFFRAVPMAYGGSQARGRIEAASLHHSAAMRDPSLICNLHHSSWECWIPSPLSKARDLTCILMDPKWVR